MDLFSSASGKGSSEPLAFRMRPRSLDEFTGQEHIVGPGKLLRRAIQLDQLSSVIFYGPPGTGKTTLAQVIANTTNSAFETLNAVLSGVKDVRNKIEEARTRSGYYDQRTILFVDEVHRWNKAQQDALLPWVENGTIVLIGATTANPYFEVNSALVSRSRVFQMLPLSKEHLLKVAEGALKDPNRGYGKYAVRFEKGALEHIVDVAGGDARSVLNALELAVETTPERFPPNSGEDIYISLEAAEESIQRRAVLYDKEGDYHFDTISAFIKSLRGSDPDAALYWLAKMIYAGEDPKFIFRRMLIAASEDVGMADPDALVRVEAAAAAFERVGMPEGRFHLTHAALVLATAKKSNSSLGFFDALQAVEQEGNAEVPTHLKDPNRDGEGFGHGAGYLYPHAYTNHWVAQQYLPGSLQGRVFYQPSAEGYEGQVQRRIEAMREAQLEAMEGYKDDAEILTFTPGNDNRDAWLDRISSGRGPILEDMRHKLFENIQLRRYDTVCIVREDTGLLIWEALRRVPEGGVYAFVPDENMLTYCKNVASSLYKAEQPVLLQKEISQIALQKGKSDNGSNTMDFSHSIDEPEFDMRPFFDAVLGRNLFLRTSDRKAAAKVLFALLKDEGIISLLEVLPSGSTRPSELINKGSFSSKEFEQIKTAEEHVYRNKGNTLLNWTPETIVELLKETGFNNTEYKMKEYSERRKIRAVDARTWTGKQGNSVYSKTLKEKLPKQLYSNFMDVIEAELSELEVDWKQSVVFFTIKKD